MATRKVKPNIAGMMQNASENVQPRPHHPTIEEIHEELTETLSPTLSHTQSSNQSPNLSPNQSTNLSPNQPQTLSPNQSPTLSSTPSPTTYVEPKKGRPFSGRTVQTRGGKQVAFDKDDDEALYMASYRTGHSQKDIIRTAVHEFLREHYNGITLDEVATTMIDDYVRKTTMI